VANYAAQTDLEAYFGDNEVLIAADREGSGSLTDVTVVAVIEAALLAATEDIDSYLALRYDLPLAETPGALNRRCCDIAMHYMSITSHAMTDDKETRNKAAIKWLGDVSRGIVTLGPKEEEVSVQDKATVSTNSETRLFSRTKMAGLL